MAQWIYDLNFIGLTTAWLAAGFIITWAVEKIHKKIRLAISRRKETEEEALKKKQEAYEAWLFRQNDDHYYGD